MKKRELFAAAAIAGTILAVNPMNAQAEELGTEATSDTGNYYEETVENETNTYTEPATLEEASENLAEAQQAVDDVKEILDNVKTAYDEAQQAADAADSACQAAEQDNITAVVAVERAYVNAVTDAENAEKDAETDVAEAEADVQQAETDKKIADQKVTEAEASLANAQADESAAETALEEAQKAADASGSDSAELIEDAEKTEALEQAKTVLAEKKDAVTATEAALSSAKTAAKAAADALTAAENKLADAEAVLAEAEDKLKRARALNLETAYSTAVTDPDYSYLNNLVNAAKESAIAVTNAEAAKEYADMCLNAKKTLYSEETAAYASVLADLARAQEDYNKFDTNYKERQAAALITVLNGVDYSPVYNFEFFQTKYPDVKAAFGNDGLATLQNFVRWGMESGRQGCESFDVYSYKNGYQDLRLAFGNDLTKYYEHYIKYGKKEGRTYTTDVSTVLNPVTSFDGVDYSHVYDYAYYIQEYADIKKAFGTDDIATLKHFVQWGMNEHRRGCESFDVLSYKNAYQDLRLAYGNDYKSYYKHYLKYGYKEGRRLTTDVTEVRNPVTVYNGIDYSAVYDFACFSANADVKAAFGNDDIATLQNFIKWGIRSGRQGSKEFNVNIYMKNYPSLVSVYGTNLRGYYLHYIWWGKKAGLVADKLI